MDSQTKNLFRVGTVSAIDEANQLVRVAFDDLDDTVSPWLQVAAWGAYTDDNYWLPDPDEQVLCLFMPTGNSDGYVLFSVRGTDNAPSNGAQGRRYIKFGDGSTVQFDRSSSAMTIDCKGAVTITAASGVAISGDVTVTGSITASGDVSAGGISLESHTHGGVESGGSSTSGPQ
ncbi:MAG: phage baseplate assembly protein [Firmicutes bacterium]|nr:phage baseplate assembly protein [Bacillota bacterium]